MKTTMGVQKTENRNFKTSNMKTLVVLTAVAVFGFMANAHATVDKGMSAEGNKHFLAMATVTNLAPTSVAMHPAEALLEVNAEEILEVENWMINESYFISPIPVTEAEALLEVESWMTSESYFASPVGVAESEEPLNVEQWMLGDQNFSAITTKEESENTLEVEDWMLNESVWGK